MAELSRASKIAAVVRVTSGNFIEMYDFFLFGFYANAISKAFFPAANEYASLMLTFASFGAGFLMRPVGAVVLGAYVDRVGRRRGLLLTLAIMAAGTALVAFVPGYSTLGLLAPLLVLAGRLLQGLSAGVELGGVSVYLSEIASPGRRGFYVSWQSASQQLAIVVSALLGYGLNAWLDKPALESWGWRIPFFVGAACALVGMRLRATMEETGEFEKARKARKERGSLAELARHPRAVLTVVGLTMGGTVAFYTYSIYMQKFLANTVGMSKLDATLVSGASLVLFAALQPLVGAISDRIGRRPILIAFGIFGTLFTVPIMTAISHTHSAWTAFFLIVAALVIVSGYTSINAVVKAELFPAEVRALGVGLPYAVTVSIFGGTAEYIALWLKQAGHEEMFYWYVTGAIFCSLLVYIFSRDSKRHSRIED